MLQDAARGVFVHDAQAAAAWPARPMQGGRVGPAGGPAGDAQVLPSSLP